MKIKDIQIDGFGVWSGLTVDAVPESMTLFYGPNEAGKTTLMQFLRAMFYGFTPQRRSRYLPPVHGGTPGGAIRVTGPGGGYEIRRHAQLTDPGATGQLSVTGHDGLTQGLHRLEMLLGRIDEPIFTNVFAIGIRELQELSTLDDTAAADELYKLSSGLDRVSLVDVLRSLRQGRSQLVGNARPEDDNSAVLSALVARRERLRDEVDQLTRGGRRYSELASQRRSQAGEIEQLVERVATWQSELRCVEVASAVYDSWQKRAEQETVIADDDQRSQLPEDAPAQLIQIDATMQERKGKLEEVKAKRRELRQRVEELPLNRRLLDLQSKIEAAAEQATWIEAIEEQLQRLDKQIDQARAQAEGDAQRLGLDDDQRESLLQQGSDQLPDLSRQTLTALIGPAKEVKTHLFVLKQAREEARQHQQQADKLGAKLAPTLKALGSDNVHDAMRKAADAITHLRSRIQVEHHLEKLRRHYRELEKEALDLATDEAFPLEQRAVQFIPFMFGGLSTIYGMVHVLGHSWFLEAPNATWGITMVFAGLVCFAIWFLIRERGYSRTSLNLEDCEHQIDSVRRQIREFEADRDELDEKIPAGNGSLEARLRESEQLHGELEAALPSFHAQQAALQASKICRNRAAEAAEGLKSARRNWSATLARLGLNESLTPSSVRQLSENYDALQTSQRRVDELLAERELRQRERTAIAKRIDTLYIEAFGDGAADPTQRTDGNDRRGRDDASRDHAAATPPRSPARQPRKDPLQQLRQLEEALASQHHWIKRRAELRDNDQQLKRHHVACVRGIERCEQQRRSLWAKCGVATAEQFYELVDIRSRLAELRKQRDELDQQIRGVIGQQVDYDDVAREIQGASAADLQRRYETLRQRIDETEARIVVLRTNQGELSQEMKQLGEDNRLAIARLELQCVEQKIQTLTRHWQTLAMASCLLEDVCATFEQERQPETLREASSFLSQLTDGKYVRVWTPLGTNRLKVDSDNGQSLDLELLSRGTREGVFIALRLSLAAAYARRGVMLPLVLDDVLVNFDRHRAMCAARTLKTFAEMGHQVLMFTCHQHIADIFQQIDVQVRQLPRQGSPGRATVLPLPEPVRSAAVIESSPPEEAPPEEHALPPAEAISPADDADADRPEGLAAEQAADQPRGEDDLPDSEAVPLVRAVEPPPEPPHDPQPQPAAAQQESAEEALEEVVESVVEPAPPSILPAAAQRQIDWHWYESSDEEESEQQSPPSEPLTVEGIWQRSDSWGPAGNVASSRG